MREGAADPGLLDVEPVDVELMVVLGVGDRRLQHLLDVARDAARREGELGERGVGASCRGSICATRLSLRALTLSARA